MTKHIISCNTLFRDDVLHLKLYASVQIRSSDEEPSIANTERFGESYPTPRHRLMSYNPVDNSVDWERLLCTGSSSWTRYAFECLCGGQSDFVRNWDKITFNEYSKGNDITSIVQTAFYILELPLLSCIGKFTDWNWSNTQQALLISIGQTPPKFGYSSSMWWSTAIETYSTVQHLSISHRWKVRAAILGWCILLWPPYTILMKIHCSCHPKFENIYGSLHAAKGRGHLKL